MNYINSEIDSPDSAIMTQIASDCRVPIVQIAAALQKPPATVASRILRLEEKGIIQGYDTVVKVQKYGVQSYRLLLTIDSMDEKERNRLFSYCQQNPRIWLAAETVGNWNFEIVFEVESHEGLEKELTALKKIFGGLISHQPWGYSYQHSLFCPLHRSSRMRLHCKQNVLLPLTQLPASSIQLPA